MEQSTIEENFHSAEGERLGLWHFVYIGYNRRLRKVFSMAWFRDGE
jgi:hypothetical protein